MNKDDIELIIDKLNGKSNFSWNELQTILGEENVHPDTFRKGCWMVKKLYDEELLNTNDFKTSKSIKNGKYVSEVIKNYTDGEHLTEEDLIQLHNLKAGKFKIKSAKSSVWGNEGNMNISSSIVYEPENTVSFEEIAEMYSRLSPRKLKHHRYQKTSSRVS